MANIWFVRLPPKPRKIIRSASSNDTIPKIKILSEKVWSAKHWRLKNYDFFSLVLSSSMLQLAHPSLDPSKGRQNLICNNLQILFCLQISLRTDKHKLNWAEVVRLQPAQQCIVFMQQLYKWLTATLPPSPLSQSLKLYLGAKSTQQNAISTNAFWWHITVSTTYYLF